MTATRHDSRGQPVTPPKPWHLVWRLAMDTARILGRLLQGLVAAAVLAALVAGLPWALWHYIGWPLPNHVPTWAEMQTVLLGPMTATVLLNFLACLCWITWAAFTIDVIRSAVDAARGARWPDISTAGPVHALAAVLVGAIVLSILGNRGAPPSPGSPSTGLGTGSAVVATAPAWQTVPDRSTASVQHAVFATAEVGNSATAREPSQPGSVVVRAPENGVHDSLWRIAQRTLDDGARWPEIFALNKGRPQPGGGTFTKPSLIFPGEELALPTDAKRTAPPDTPQQPAPDPTTPPPATAPPPTSSVPSSPATSAPSTQHAPPTATTNDTAPSPTPEPGFSWGPELFVGLGLAGAVSAALLVARRRYRRRYQPGSGRRDDLPVAPVVYQLRLAHLRAQHDDKDLDLDLDEDYDGDDERGARLCAPPPPLVVGAGDPAEPGSRETSSLAPELGVRDGREVALDLAVARGLGLVGEGSSAAARALVLAALTTTPSSVVADSADHQAATSQPVRTSVLVPADDLVGLLGHDPRTQLPARLRVVASLQDALDVLETETLVRARNHDRDEDQGPWPAVVLVTRPLEHYRRRLQAVLDNGSAFGIVGVLLGQWQPGVTAYVREDGTISATSPGLGEALRGTRVFRLGDDHTTELLALLRRAQHEVASHEETLPPVPRPRLVSTDPSNKHTDSGDAWHGGTTAEPVSDAVRAADTELEVTAVASAVEPPDTELEIVGPSVMPAPGTRLRPPATVQEIPAASVPISQETSRKNEAANDEQPPNNVELAADSPTREVSVGDTAAAAPIRITVLGPPRVYWRTVLDRDATEITGMFQPRMRELLVFLAVHPDGATREALVAALWADSPPEKTTNTLNTALSRLRRALAKATDGALTDVVVIGDGRYQLDPALVDVDYWRFDRAVATRRGAATEQARIDAYREVVNSYGGPLADGMSTEWIESAREAIRRDAIDAVAALARALVDDDPQQTLDLLEVARAFDPHNELLYRDIMRLQERLGRLDAIPRTLTLLTTRLAEVDDQPTPQAIGLAARLRQRHDDPPIGQAHSSTGGDRGSARHGRSSAAS